MKISAISFNCKRCGDNRFVVNKYGSGGCSASKCNAGICAASGFGENKCSADGCFVNCVFIFEMS